MQPQIDHPVILSTQAPAGHAISTLAEVPATSRKWADITIGRDTFLSTRLDSESFSLVLNRFYGQAHRALKRHGGIVAKFIGDAVVGVFGIPARHEDDALRAARAALELRAALAELNRDFDQKLGVRLSVRTAVNTGEVVVSNPSDGANATVLGEPVNIASRLQNSAGPDEIILGHATYSLVRHLAVVRGIPPLSLKGKDTPVTAWRLLALDPTPRDADRRMATPFVGREAMLRVLHALFERTRDESSCHLVTVLGESGAGKTRLLQEFKRGVEERSTYLSGHCPPYGDDVTFLPLVEIIRRAVGIHPSDSIPVAEARLAALAETDPRIPARVGQLLGLRKGSAELGDTYWALSRMLALLAARRPLVIAIEDLHYAKPSLLEFIEYIATSCRNAPILLICLARPEFLDEPRDWGSTSRRINASSLVLRPLRAEETEQLVEQLLTGGVVPPELRERLADAVGGNPLFAEELVANLLEENALRLEGGRWVPIRSLTVVPTMPRIDALLAARLDRLEPAEQAIIEQAAVVGVPFHAAEIPALSPDIDPADVAVGLLSLVRKELLDSEPTATPPGTGEQDFRFRHNLIRDTAYRGILKVRRATLHERYANWLEREAGEQVRALNLDETLGVHLRDAYRYRMELAATGAADREIQALGRRAGLHLATAGRRALLRGDTPRQVAELLRDAVQLLGENDAIRREVLLDLAAARRDAGQLELALETYQEALAAATAAGDRRHAGQAMLGRLEVQSDYGSRRFQRFLRDSPAAIEQALPVFRELDDDHNLARAWRLLALRDAAIGRSTAAAVGADRAVGHARRAGDERLEGSCLRLHCFILDWGPTPLKEVIRYCEAAREWAKGRGRGFEDAALNILARAAAMQGEFKQAHMLLGEARKLRDPFFWAALLLTEAAVDLLEERPDAALRCLDTRASDVATHAIALTVRARALILLGRYDEADEVTRQCERVAARSQLDAQIKWRELRAVALAYQGDLAKAERLARRALDLAKQTEQPDSKAQVLGDLAEVLSLASRPDETVLLLQQAVDLYVHKGNTVMAERARRDLARLRT
jgi:class 3 adenylate cyclase/tetratricopeptide (TPR) repeat protein